MPYGIDNETEEWFKGLEKKLYAKLKTQCLRLGSIMPYVPEHGCYYDMGARELTAWTNGFYAGMLWQMYHAFKEEEFRRAAEGIEERLDAALEEFVKLDHDVGFLWLHTAVADWRLTGNETMGQGTVIRPFSNMNLIFPNVRIPAVHLAIEPALRNLKVWLQLLLHRRIL